MKEKSGKYRTSRIKKRTRTDNRTGETEKGGQAGQVKNWSRTEK